MPDPKGEQRTLTALTITNVLLAILAASIAAVFLYVEFFAKPDISPQQTERYAAVARERLDEHAEVIRSEVVSLASDTVPPIADAVYQQMQEDYPLYLRALEEEGEIYLANVERIFIERVKDRYRDYLQAHREVLREEFPNHASDENVERILDDFEEAFNRIAERYYLEEFRHEADRTVELWNRIEPVPPPGPADPSLQEQLADYTADWAALAVTEPAPDDRLRNIAPNDDELQ
jgi:hypothetical protein